MTVNKERVAQLVTALRSGEYAQWKGSLRQDLGDGTQAHCCLGVACDIYEKATGVDVDWLDGVLPYNVRNWFGFDQANPRVGDREADQDDDDYRPKGIVEIPASHANDELDWSFEEIANAFEDLYVKDPAPV